MNLNTPFFSIDVSNSFFLYDCVIVTITIRLPITMLVLQKIRLGVPRKPSHLLDNN
ncbi:hypothetical protein PL2TA16_02024 [Pseudoalteromonas luteoviolacea 2ta16]|uniref:Uncharacterized protein n=1 Tax=Pseudoalteromonas luteoviolacea (strain 2ta16) TaxID=1353533 RepID=V4J4R9_PSEL2|nr:hypothetical protein PL2TA16_02024 [Pseudoalteromonas luteoviolacea 2ta16]